MKGRVLVALTPKQLDVLRSLCGYATAGEPDDVGLSASELRTVRRAHEALDAAWLGRRFRQIAHQHARSAP